MKIRNKISGVYSIISPSNKIYIGQSWDIMKRWNYYRNLQCKSQTYLYNSLKYHGFDNHKFNVIETYEGNNQVILNELEHYHWNRLKLEGFEMLNCREPFGYGGKLSEETKKKISLSKIGKTHTQETKSKLSMTRKGWRQGDKNPMYGKIGANKGKVFTLEHRKKISESNKGKIAHNKGIPISSKQKEALMNANLGKNKSFETKFKISQANSGSNNPSAKLNEEKVFKIRQLSKEGIKVNVIAKLFNISNVTVFKIKSGKIWKSILNQI